MFNPFEHGLPDEVASVPQVHHKVCPGNETILHLRWTNPMRIHEKGTSERTERFFSCALRRDFVSPGTGHSKPIKKFLWASWPGERSGPSCKPTGLLEASIPIQFNQSTNWRDLKVGQVKNVGYEGIIRTM